MEKEFIEWYEANERRFAHGQFDEKQIAYSAWLDQDMPIADDMSVCPNCRSKNIRWVFYISIDEPLAESICQDCRYRDELGGFEKTNQIIHRENKINQILDNMIEK